MRDVVFGGVFPKDGVAVKHRGGGSLELFGRRLKNCVIFDCLTWIEGWGGIGAGAGGGLRFMNNLCGVGGEVNIGNGAGDNLLGGGGVVMLVG